MATKNSFKVIKTRKLSKAPKLPTIVEYAPFRFQPNTATSHQVKALQATPEVGTAPSFDLPYMPRHSINKSIHCGSSKPVSEVDCWPYDRPNHHPFLYYNGNYYTVEECRLILSLKLMSADDDLVSEIIKHERGIQEPVNCAGLHQYLANAQFSTIRSCVLFPLLADAEAARTRARNAYRKWMEYMTGVVWWYQDLDWDHVLLSMAPFPFHWMDLVPSRPRSKVPLFGEVTDDFHDIGANYDERRDDRKSGI